MRDKIYFIKNGYQIDIKIHKFKTTLFLIKCDQIYRKNQHDYNNIRELKDHSITTSKYHNDECKLLNTFCEMYLNVEEAI